MSINKSIILAGCIGALIGATIITAWHGQQHDSHAAAPTSEEKKPLYWVAPMDANYRRDKPGKSPMGMDLIPVYDESSASAANAIDEGPGTIKIAPHVVNNLGVRTTRVEWGQLQTEVNTVGYVKFDEDKLIHIHPRVEGWIEKLYVKASGDPVVANQPLYTLYSPQLVNAQEELLLALKRNDSALLNAARERLQALQLTPQFIAELEQSRQVQQTITFYTPQTGVVEGLAIREGFYVKPGTTLFSIGALDQVWVEAEVFERDAALIQPGQPVAISTDFLPARQWFGVVDYIYPSLNSENRALRVRIKVDNTDQQLKPNMFTQVAIHTQPREATLLVPKQAIIRTGKQDRVVLALGDGHFKSIAVTLGDESDDKVEILSGLEQGEEVVVSAQFLIDSESSKNSDFKRLSDEEVPSATVSGEINAINTERRVLNISRGPIEKWNRGPATMDFYAAKGVDLNAVKPGDHITFTFEVRDEFIVVAISHVHSMHHSKGE